MITLHKKWVLKEGNNLQDTLLVTILQTIVLKRKKEVSAIEGNRREIRTLMREVDTGEKTSTQTQMYLMYCMVI